MKRSRTKERKKNTFDEFDEKEIKNFNRKKNNCFGSEMANLKRTKDENEQTHYYGTHTHTHTSFQ